MTHRFLLGSIVFIMILGIISVHEALVPDLPLRAREAVSATAPEAVVSNSKPTDGSRVFRVAEGLAIELVAGPPLINRPVNACFDDHGRLYVTEVAGAVERADVAAQKKLHRVLRLEDTNGDGKFDRSTVYADEIPFLEGAMWLRGSLYVAAPPHIWKFTDMDGDGKADKREIWFDGKTLTGCANDLHGPYAGPDGMIYWCKGAFAKQEYTLANGKTWSTRASHIFRARRDGTGIEPVMIGGMDNPVDVVFTPTGERIFCTTFFQHPSLGKRDGLIHAIYGGIYGKDHEPIYEHPWTSPQLMPVMTHLGPAAPCGLHRYEGDSLGNDYRDNIFCTQFNLRKVSRHRLIREGATFRTEDSDLVVSDDPDFHPTDVIEDADGSLIVIDTGGWYKLCCPSSQLLKPDVLGGIYRIRRKDAPLVKDPWGKELTWNSKDAVSWIDRLADPRVAVQHRAIEELAANPNEEVRKALVARAKVAASVTMQVNLLWTASRIDHPDMRSMVRHALRNPNLEICHTAIHVVSLWRDSAAREILEGMLTAPSPVTVRLAAEAIGRLGDAAAIPALLQAFRPGQDRTLDHALTFALIEIGAANQLDQEIPKLKGKSLRASLIALEQISGTKLKSSAVVPYLTADDAELRETAWWIAARHPEWSAELRETIEKRLTRKLAEPAEKELSTIMARLASNKLMQDFLADLTQNPSTSRFALQTMTRAALRNPPTSWGHAIQAALKSEDRTILRSACLAARALPVPKDPPRDLIQALEQVGRNPQLPDELRLLAFASIPGGLASIENELFTFLVQQLDREKEVSLRSNAAEVLSRAGLRDNQLQQLAGILGSTGPMELTKLLACFGRGGNEAVGLALLKGLDTPMARAALRAPDVKPILAKYPVKVQQHGEELIRSLEAALTDQRKKLEGMLDTLKMGDVRRGQLVFNSTKAACVSCHKIGYVGGQIGPDLTRIGSIRNERDLLESIVIPSASFVQTYEPVRITTKSGKDFNGLLRKDTPDEVVLVIAADQEVRILRQDIEEVKPSKVSIMPAGLDQQLTVQELADLIAFLKACR